VRKYLSIAFTVALVALAAGFMPSPARAGEVLKGTFELPAAAYWGDTLLQPGEYTVVMDIGYSKPPVVHLTGEGVRVNMLTMSMPFKESGRSILKLEDINGTYVVREFDAGFLGKAYPFEVTKSVRNKALRASAGPSIELPVSTGAGF
jgi:hypothetical protein